MSWYLEMNQFADLTPEEFSVRKGLRVDRIRSSHQKARRRPGPRGEVPDSIDWNADGAVRYNFYTISVHYFHTMYPLNPPTSR